MLAQLEALLTFVQQGTMTRATALRISQSAVSKRIAALEAELGLELVARQGRHAGLTPEAVRLVERAGPLLAELKAALKSPGAERRGTLTVGVSESIVSSWGAAVLYAAEQATAGLTLGLHAHRGPVVVERVAAGEYALGLVAGEPAAGLEAREIGREPLVVIPAGTGFAAHDAKPAKSAARGRELAVITIEERSATWAAVARRAHKQGIVVERRVESFFAAARLAMAGFGHGLVPLGVAATLGIKRARLWRFPPGTLERPLVVVGRKSALARPLAAGLVGGLQASLAPLAASWER